MSTSLFIHDFFRDGRSDALAEVRILQHSGLWTKEKRASWIKQTRAYREHLKHIHPCLPQVGAYYAGRIAALKSRQIADVVPLDDTPAASTDTLVYRPLKPSDHRFCGLLDCGSDAVWGVSYTGDSQIFLALCDPCRQEWVRQEVYTTPDGWDWDEDEDLMSDDAERDPHCGKILPYQHRAVRLSEQVWVGLTHLLDLTTNVTISLVMIQLSLAALVMHLVLLNAKEIPLMTIVDSSYEHFLFYDDFDRAEAALEYIKETFDKSAELCPLSDEDETCMVTFDTNEELLEEQAQELIELLSPDDFSLNDPYNDEGEDQ
jgi:hypothetical protein